MDRGWFNVQRFEELFKYVASCTEHTLHRWIANTVILTIDVEAYERQTNIVTEIGLAALRLGDVVGVPPVDRGCGWTSKIKTIHYRIDEHWRKQNKRWVAGNAQNFLFGVSEYVPEAKIGPVIRQWLRSLGATRTLTETATTDSRRRESGDLSSSDETTTEVESAYSVLSLDSDSIPNAIPHVDDQTSDDDYVHVNTVRLPEAPADDIIDFVGRLPEYQRTELRFIQGAFDNSHDAKWIMSLGITWPFVRGGAEFDTQSLAAEVMHSPGRTHRVSLEDCASLLGVQTGYRHNAGNDAHFEMCTLLAAALMTPEQQKLVSTGGTLESLPAAWPGNGPKQRLPPELVRKHRNEREEAYVAERTAKERPLNLGDVEITVKLSQKQRKRTTAQARVGRALSEK